MKSIIKLAIFILFAYGVAFVACTRDPVSSIVAPPPPPPPPPPTIGKTIKVKVVEYNNGNPITGAVLNLRPDYPKMNTQSLTTDQNGTCSFVTTTNQFSSISVFKSGFWNLEPQSDYGAPLIFFPNTTQYTPGNDVSSADSFVVKLFPAWNITMHLKDTSGSHLNAGFQNSGLFNLNGNTYKRAGTWFQLYPHIDTTFQLPVFGNMDNEFTIYTCYDDDCFLWVELLTKVQFMTNGNNLTMNIFY